MEGEEKVETSNKLLSKIMYLRESRLVKGYLRIVCSGYLTDGFHQAFGEACRLTEERIAQYNQPKGTDLLYHQ